MSNKKLRDPALEAQRQARHAALMAQQAANLAARQQAAIARAAVVAQANAARAASRQQAQAAQAAQAAGSQQAQAIIIGVGNAVAGPSNIQVSGYASLSQGAGSYHLQSMASTQTYPALPHHQ